MKTGSVRIDQHEARGPVLLSSTQLRGTITVLTWSVELFERIQGGVDLRGVEIDEAQRRLREGEFPALVMRVGVADPARRDADQNIRRADLRYREFDILQGIASCTSWTLFMEVQRLFARGFR